MAKLTAVPISLKKANNWIEKHHRHNGRTVRDGGKFAVGVTDGKSLFGVAIVGNPLSATYMDGYTAEVLRVCVIDSAPKNCNSFLYARCTQAWRAMGGTRLITYTLQSESQSSLKALKQMGWRIAAASKSSGAWGRKSKSDGMKRQSQEIYYQEKWRWEWGEQSVQPASHITNVAGDGRDRGQLELFTNARA